MQKYLILPITLLLMSLPGMAQQGLFVDVFGLGQESRLANRSDLANYSITHKPGYDLGAGAGLLYNFEENFGWYLGGTYSPFTQRYQTNTERVNSGYFESQVQLNLLRIPLMFMFHSNFGSNDVVNLSLGVGFQGNILTGASASTEPNPGFSYDRVDLTKYYKGYTTSFVSQGNVNFYFSENWAIIAGVRMERGISDIEKKDLNVPDDAPLELHFPISIPKNIVPDVTVRDAAKPVATGIILGVRVRLAELAE